jgi:DNA-binding MarR family transcriptional regulator
MIDRLFEKGMVERKRNDVDRRVVRVSVTPLAEKITSEAIEGALKVIRNVFKDVSQSDREEYLSLVKRVEAAQENARSESVMKTDGGPEN